MSKASEYQPTPVNRGDVVLPHVLSDVAERAEMGKAKHGDYLHSRNGRDPLWDAYQEAIDLVFYLRQAIMEREA